MPGADTVVYSSTLGAPSTASTGLERHFDPGAVHDLKAAAGRDLLVGGSAGSRGRAGRRAPTVRGEAERRPGGGGRDRGGAVGVAGDGDPDEAKSDEVDCRIGEQSGFHELHGVYAQGVSLSTAILLQGWERRCVPFDEARPETAAMRVEKHDLVVSKLVAGRQKDLEFAIALVAAGLVEVQTLIERAAALPRPRAVVNRVRDAIGRCARLMPRRTVASVTS